MSMNHQTIASWNKPTLLAGGAVVIAMIAAWIWIATPEKPTRNIASEASVTSGRERNLSPTGRAEQDEPRNNAEAFNRELPVSHPIATQTTTSQTYPDQPPARKMIISGESELELQLAPGVREPTVLIAPDEEMTPAQSAALNATLEVFVSRLEAAAAAGRTDEEIARIWEEGMAEADSTYRNIFGSAAFDRQATEAAVRALGYPSRKEDPSGAGAAAP